MITPIINFLFLTILDGFFNLKRLNGTHRVAITYAEAHFLSKKCTYPFLTNEVVRLFDGVFGTSNSRYLNRMFEETEGSSVVYIVINR